MAELDRVITITVDQGGTRTQHGEYTPDNVTFKAWARRTDTGADRLLETHGARGEVRRTYRIRYDTRVRAAIEAGRRVVIDDPDSDLDAGIVTLAEPRGTRRRFLDVSVEGST